MRSGRILHAPRVLHADVYFNDRITCSTRTCVRAHMISCVERRRPRVSLL